MCSKSLIFAFGNLFSILYRFLSGIKTTWIAIRVDQGSSHLIFGQIFKKHKIKEKFILKRGGGVFTQIFSVQITTCHFVSNIKYPRMHHGKKFELSVSRLHWIRHGYRCTHITISISWLLSFRNCEVPDHTAKCKFIKCSVILLFH